MFRQRLDLARQSQQREQELARQRALDADMDPYVFEEMRRRYEREEDEELEMRERARWTEQREVEANGVVREDDKGEVLGNARWSELEERDGMSSEEIYFRGSRAEDEKTKHEEYLRGSGAGEEERGRQGERAKWEEKAAERYSMHSEYSEGLSVCSDDDLLPREQFGRGVVDVM
jgi:hypothetical protein